MDKQRLAFVDALRALAIAGVFLVHSGVAHLFGPAGEILVNQGRTGIQLFMLVSGLTLMHAWHGRAARGEADGFMKFVARRWLRLAPMYYLGIGLYVGLAALGVGLAARSFDTFDVAMNFTMLHGWLPSSQNSVVPGGWSIGAEFSFYLLFALIVPWIRKPWQAIALLVASATAAGPLEELYRSAFPWLITRYDQGTWEIFFYFWAPRQFAAFAAGMVLYFLMKRKRDKKLGQVLVVLAVSLWIWVALRGEKVLDEMVFYALDFCVLGLGLYHWPWRGLVNRVSSHLGYVSYSIYVLHFAVLAAGNWVRGLLGPQAESWPVMVVYVLLCAGVTVALATLTHAWIERPVMAWGARMLAPRRGAFLQFMEWTLEKRRA